MARDKPTKIPAHFLARALACQLRIRIGFRLVRLIRAHLALKTHHRNAEIVWRRVLLTLLELKTLQASSRLSQPAIERKLFVGDRPTRGRTLHLPRQEFLDFRIRRAEQGRGLAQRGSSSVLPIPRGITQSTTEALAWYQNAAEHGDALSAYKLGEIYEDGGPFEMIQLPDGTFAAGSVPQSAAIPKDFARAAFWYRIGADLGEPAAQNGLGRLYALGEGVPQDYGEAYFWLSLAEVNGVTSHTNGLDDREVAASHLTEATLMQVQVQARKWFDDHAAKTSRP
jgi:hypothetical protein